MHWILLCQRHNAISEYEVSHSLAADLIRVQSGLDPGDVFGTQFNVQSIDGGLQMVGIGGANQTLDMVLTEFSGLRTMDIPIPPQETG